MSRILTLHTPADLEAVRSLELGDMVYLDGEVVLAAGLPTMERIHAHCSEPRSLPIDLHGSTLLHFGSYSHERDGVFRVEYMNPTTSTRFNAYMPQIVRSLGLRIVGGKGGLDHASVEAMREAGCVYLSFPGGLCTLYSAAIREIRAVEWRDLIFHYRLVKLRVEGLGPGTVGIDAHGHSLFESLQTAAQARLPQILSKLGEERR